MHGLLTPAVTALGLSLARAIAAFFVGELGMTRVVLPIPHQLAAGLGQVARRKIKPSFVIGVLVNPAIWLVVLTGVCMAARGVLGPHGLMAREILAGASLGVIYASRVLLTASGRQDLHMDFMKTAHGHRVVDVWETTSLPRGQQSTAPAKRRSKNRSR